MFKTFGKLKDSQSVNKKGTGLGLNISQRIVASMGGEITIESEVKKGSKFKMFFYINVKNPEYRP